MTLPPNEGTPADGERPILFAFVAQWPAPAEFLRSVTRLDTPSADAPSIGPT